MVRAGEEHTRTIMDAKRRKHDSGVSLPEDIVFQVLAWLPTKALCRFRCVCKGWRALISDPAFMAAHRSRAADRHLVGVFLGARCLPEVRVIDMDGKVVSTFDITRNKPLPPQLPTARQDLKSFEITRSTPRLPTRLGLICADGTGLTWEPHGGMIIDPAARRAFAVFDMTGPATWGRTYAYSTIFGRATPSGAFKVLRLWKLFPMDHHGGIHQLCEVATIMDGSGGGTAEPLTWRQKSATPFVITNRSLEHKAIVNGVVYFIHELKIVDGGDDAAPIRNRIVAFDIESEEWKAETINGPSLGHGKEGEIWVFALVELKGTLGLVHDVRVNKRTYTNIWLLTDPDKSVWVREYTMIPMPENLMRSAKPLGVLADDRLLLLSSMMSRRQDKTSGRYYRYRDVVLFYDPRTKAFTDFVELAQEFRETLVFYTGSLLS